MTLIGRDGTYFSRKSSMVILVLVAMMTLVGALDSTIVNISLVDIGTALGCTQSETSWIVISYMLPMVGLIVIFGKAFQNRPMKGIIVIGTIFFAISSVFCGMSNSIGMMVIWRFIQGVSSSILASATPVLIVRELPENKVSIGMAVMAIFTGVATTLGPALGSAITNALSWNWIFFINIPFCIILLLAIIFVFKPSAVKIDSKPLPDVAISICYVISVMAFIYFVTMLGRGFEWYLVWVLVASVVLGIFVYRSCLKGDGDSQLFHRSLLTNKEVMLSLVSFVCTTITASQITYLLPFYLRQALNVSSGDVGLFFMASAALTILCSVIAGKWCQSHGCKGVITMAIFLRIAFASIFIFVTPEMGIVPVLIAMVFMGASFGLSGTAQTTRIIQHAGPKDKEDASNIMLTANFIGISMGVALCVIVMFFTVPMAGGAPIADFSVQMVTDSIHSCSLFSIIVNLIALICTLIVRNIVPAKTNSHPSRSRPLHTRLQCSAIVMWSESRIESIIFSKATKIYLQDCQTVGGQSCHLWTCAFDRLTLHGPS